MLYCVRLEWDSVTPLRRYSPAGLSGYELPIRFWLLRRGS
jgi:hypothetical protein